MRKFAPTAGLIGIIASGALLVWAAIVPTSEPIDPTRIPNIAANRTAIEQCNTNRRDCVGGFVLFRGTMAIRRISNGKEGLWTYDIVDLTNITGGVLLDGIQDIVLPSDARWDEFAKKYAKQFVASK